MNIRRQQEMELEAAVHGVPVKKGTVSRSEEPPSSAVPGSTTLSPETVALDKQLSEGIAKGLPIKIVRRKR